MDKPIYLQFLDGRYDASRPPTAGPRYRWFVIEERGDQETSADELGEEHWIRKSPEERVRDLSLPHLNYDVTDAAFAVFESRLFFVGGFNVRKDEDIIEPSGIIYIDLQQQPSDLSWKRCEKWGKDTSCVIGAVVSEYDHSIYALLADKVLRFDCRNVEEGNFCPPLSAEFWPRFLLASSGSEMLLYKPAGLSKDSSMHSDDNRLGQLSLYAPKTDSLRLFCNLNDPPCADWTYMPSPFYRTVMEGQFLIYFADFCPMKEDYCPALYVYDMELAKWHSGPVQGLPNDGIILPSLDTRRPTRYASLMQVRRDCLKLALVWTVKLENYEDGGVNDQTEVHWSKFIVNIGGDAEGYKFQAEILSSGTCYGGHTLLINCTAG